MSERDDNAHGEPRPLAAEYVLGVLDAADRREAERRIASDAGFAAEVEAWQRHFAPLNAEIAEVEPPAAVWDRVAGALGHDEGRAGGLWSSLAFWRGLAAVTTALAAACLAALLYLPSDMLRRPQPELVATLDADEGAPTFIARFDPNTSALAIKVAHTGAGTERVPELWIIPGDGVPRSLGVIGPAGVAAFDVPPAHSVLMHEGGTLAITLEPPGGAPEGKPTGPVVASGKLVSL